MQKLSSSIFTYFFIGIASLLILLTGVLGAIMIAGVYSHGPEVLLSDAYSQIIFFLFAVLSTLSVYAKNTLDSVRFLYLSEETIEAKRINLVPEILPVGTPLPDASFGLDKVIKISSNRILKNLVHLTFARNGEERSVKSFVKWSHLSKLQSLAKAKNT